MKLALARVLFFASSLAVTALATEVCHEPTLNVISVNAQSARNHSIASSTESNNNVQVLALFLFGMSQRY